MVRTPSGPLSHNVWATLRMNQAFRNGVCMIMSGSCMQRMPACAGANNSEFPVALATRRRRLPCVPSPPPWDVAMSSYCTQTCGSGTELASKAHFTCPGNCYAAPRVLCSAPALPALCARERQPPCKQVLRGPSLGQATHVQPQRKELAMHASFSMHENSVQGYIPSLLCTYCNLHNLW